MAVGVLIVDDHSSFRRLARRMLCAAGFSVVGEAGDAAAALALARELEPDVVLLDIVLPDASGLAVARELSLAAHPPRVILTSSRDFGSAFEWPDGCEFIPKHRLSGTLLSGRLQAP